jgi:hypothetical protein
MTALRVVGVFLVVGCAHGAPPGGDPVIAIADSSSSAAKKAAGRTAAHGGCTLRAESWAPPGEDDGAPLFVGGQSYFQVSSGSLELKISSGVSADAIPAQVASHGVKLRGALRSQHLGLYLRRPVVFEEAVIPTAQARLSWSGVSDRGIVVTHDLLGGIEADRLRTTVPCRDLALTPERFELPADVYDPDRGRKARLRDDRRIPLSTSPGAAPVMWIDVSRWEVEGWTEMVRELSFDGSHSRIVWKRDRELVFGWVPGDALYGADDGGEDHAGRGYGLIGMLAGNMASDEPDGRRRCRQALELSASIEGGPKRVVGTLDGGTPFEVVDDEAEEATHVGIWVSEVFDVTLIPQPGVELWVGSAALARCGR